MSFISLGIFIILFIILFIIELKRNEKYDNIIGAKSRFNSNTIHTIYLISIIFMVLFTIINLIIGEKIELCLMTLIISIVIMLVAFLLSRKCIYILEGKIINVELFGKEVIEIKNITEVELGYFIKVSSNNSVIKIETKFFDNNIQEIKKVLLRYKKGEHFNEK